jgi:hypothetical protein
MSIIDIYVDSICAISQSSVDSLHVPSDNAASSDAAPSELEPHVNTPIRQLRACTCMVLLRMTYQNSRSQGLTEKIVHDIRHLEMCAILLGIMWYFGGYPVGAPSGEESYASRVEEDIDSAGT